MTTRHPHQPLRGLAVVVGELEVDGNAEAWRSVDPAPVDDELAQLHRRLIAPAGRPEGCAEEAMALLESIRQRPTQAVTTALLVVTHPRFEHCSRTLVHRLAASDLLAAAGLDELAGVLLHEPRVMFSVPATWLETELDLPAGTRVRAPGLEVAHSGDERDHTAQVPQSWRTPAAARRWAATRLLDAGLVEIDEVLRRSHEVDNSAGGALVCGVLDAWASLSTSAIEQALAAALAWPRGAVRRRALDILDASGRLEEARAHAAADGDARVRAWEPAAPREERASGQQPLFDA